MSIQGMYKPRLIDDLDVPPDNRLVPELGNGEALELIREIQNELHQAELISVARGIRRAATVHVRSTHLMNDLNRVVENRLLFLPILECAPVQGFAHKFYDPEPGKPRDVFGVVTKKLSHAKAFKKAFMGNDHAFVGRMLGYPNCCIKFFDNTWPEIIDPVWQWAINSPHKVVDENTVEVTGYPECNILLRYFNLRSTPHIVCSSVCESTRNLSRKFSKLIPHYDDLIELLSQPITWDNHKGVANIRFPGFFGLGNSTPYEERKVIKWVL